MGAGIAVRVTQRGYYNHRVYEIGETLLIQNMKEKGSWMELLEPEAAVKVAEQAAKEKDSPKAKGRKEHKEAMDRGSKSVL